MFCVSEHSQLWGERSGSASGIGSGSATASGSGKGLKPLMIAQKSIKIQTTGKHFFPLPCSPKRVFIVLYFI